MLQPDNSHDDGERFSRLTSVYSRPQRDEPPGCLVQAYQLTLSSGLRFIMASKLISWSGLSHNYAYLDDAASSWSRLHRLQEHALSVWARSLGGREDDAASSSCTGCPRG